MVTRGYRTATAADVEAIVALVESAYRGEASRAGWTTEADLLDGQRTDADTVAATIAASDRRVLLAFEAEALEAEALVGCCELRRLPQATAYFGMFAVVPTLQGGGVGGELLTEAESVVRREWQATRMEMTVIAQREDLIAWYERRGYRRTGATEPFPYGDERFGLPRRDDLFFERLAKPL
ncbi:MAG TPA: GNAT family N-acetyltransferase [Mycobacteriales bacterium]|nr:GNAT family N-acetyltransferase [Mycobacteriales bacterium]HWA65633.1 GNAT family N-acetyltransferase [Mycobacteriales bacterium]